MGGPAVARKTMAPVVVPIPRLKANSLSVPAVFSECLEKLPP